MLKFYPFRIIHNNPFQTEDRVLENMHRVSIQTVTNPSTFSLPFLCAFSKFYNYVLIRLLRGISFLFYLLVASHLSLPTSHLMSCPVRPSTFHTVINKIKILLRPMDGLPFRFFELLLPLPLPKQDQPIKGDISTCLIFLPSHNAL